MHLPCPPSLSPDATSPSSLKPRKDQTRVIGQIPIILSLKFIHIKILSKDFRFKSFISGCQMKDFVVKEIFGNVEKSGNNFGEQRGP